jgi:hypothetical protein
VAGLHWEIVGGEVTPDEIRLERQRLAIETRLKRIDQRLASEQFAHEKRQSAGLKAILTPTGGVFAAAALGLLGTGAAKWADNSIEHSKQQTAIILEASKVSATLAPDQQEVQRARNLLWFATWDYLQLPDDLLRELKTKAALEKGQSVPPPVIQSAANPSAIQPEAWATGPMTDAEQSLVSACRENNVTDVAQLAYVLATVRWETAQTFKPLKEAYWLSEDWRKKNLQYYPYYGRGLVQLTWKANYEKVATLIGDNDLVENPDKALDPKLAARIACVVLRDGIFGGKKLSDFIAANGVPDFPHARQIVNGMDHASQIAAMADQYLLKLKANP